MIHSSGVIINLATQGGMEDIVSQMPLDYRVLTKMLLSLPTGKTPFFIFKGLPMIQTIVSCITLMSLVAVYSFFSVLVYWVATQILFFPLNALFGLILPTIAFLFFLRSQLMKEIRWWRSVFNSIITWDPSTIDEYIELVKRQQHRHTKDKQVLDRSPG